MNKNYRLKQARKNKRLSQVELAKALGSSQAYVSKLEIGEDYSLSQAEKLAHILDVTAEWLYYDHEEKNSYNTTNEPNQLVAINESLREIIKSKEETIQALKDQIEYLRDRLSQYENQPKTGTR